MRCLHQLPRRFGHVSRYRQGQAVVVGLARPQSSGHFWTYSRISATRHLEHAPKSIVELVHGYCVLCPVFGATRAFGL